MTAPSAILLSRASQEAGGDDGSHYGAEDPLRGCRAEWLRLGFIATMVAIGIQSAFGWPDPKARATRGRINTPRMAAATSAAGVAVRTMTLAVAEPARVAPGLGLLGWDRPACRAVSG